MEAGTTATEEKKESLSKQLKTRGLVFQHSGTSLEAILDGESRTLYLGIDPTADSLHVGHLVPLIAARYCARHGHRVIILVGGGTGRIGDPSGKSAERSLLPDEEIERNAEKIIAQVRQIFGGQDFSVMNNAQWLGSAVLIDFLRDIGKHFTVNEMLQKETIKKRVTDPDQSISYTEFSYLLLQSYDFLHLHETEGCTLQIGGSDQWGNITAGIELVKKKTGHEVHGLTTQLAINKATGKKFGKTESGAVWLDGAQTSPYAFHQFWFNVDDASVVDFLKMYTFLPMAEIEMLARDVKEKPQERNAQRVLAREMTRLVHGEVATETVERVTAVLFGSDSPESLSTEERQMLIDGSLAAAVSESECAAGISLVDVLLRVGAGSSKRDARQLISEGSVMINSQKVSDMDKILSTEDFVNGILFLRKGKRDMYVIHLS